jgi:hypothetical protein
MKEKEISVKIPYHFKGEKTLINFYYINTINYSGETKIHLIPTVLITRVRLFNIFYSFSGNSFYSSRDP